MSPSFAAKPRAGSSSVGHAVTDGDSDPMLLRVDNGNDDPALWKAQRKLKHERDFGKRASSAAATSAAAKPKFKQHGHHHGHQRMPLQELRRERDLWFSGQPSSSSSFSIANTNVGRLIPARRRSAAAPSGANRAAMSKSVPTGAPASWPPTLASSSGVAFDENDELHTWDRNVDASANTAPLSSSAPKASTPIKRPMTLFETATFFNEAGHLLNHDTFELDDTSSTSPPDAAVNKRKLKPKRRVGRHKPLDTSSSSTSSSKHNDANDALVLSLMAQLLPAIDVGKELNLRLLASTSSSSFGSGDVFDFEIDDTSRIDAHARRPTSTKKNPLLDNVDLLKFQAALTTMLGDTNSATALEPLDRIDDILTTDWVAKTLLVTVQFDVAVQNDRFAVLLARFRVATRVMRHAILDAIVATALAVFALQGVESTTGQFPHHNDNVAIKGLVALLAAIVDVLAIEASKVDHFDTFGQFDTVNNATISAYCDQLCCALQLLLRCAPGSTRRCRRTGSDDSQTLEKFSIHSQSLEATTYAALTEVLEQLAALSPAHGDALLRWLLRKWPARNVQLELYFVRFVGALLAQFSRCGRWLPPDVVARAFARIASSITSPHFLIAQEASTLCGNGDRPLLDVYLARDASLRECVASALHANAQSHWNTRIRELSDERFDMLLDLA